MNRHELEKRLVDFSGAVIELTNNLRASQASRYMASQLIRSGTSPALNYAEAQEAESIRDFIHKLKITLKELRETHVALKIVDNSNLCRDLSMLKKVLQENDELVAILVSSIKTSKRNL